MGSGLRRPRPLSGNFGPNAKEATLLLFMTLGVTSGPPGTGLLGTVSPLQIVWGGSREGDRGAE